MRGNKLMAFAYTNNTMAEKEVVRPFLMHHSHKKKRKQ